MQLRPALHPHALPRRSKPYTLLLETKTAKADWDIPSQPLSYWFLPCWRMGRFRI